MATELIAPYNSVAVTRAGVTPVLPAYDGEPIYLRDDRGTVGTTIVYTVPAGYVLYLFNWSSRRVAAAATTGSAYVNIRNAAAALRFTFAHADDNTVWASRMVGGYAHVPFVIPPTWDIAITVLTVSHYCSFSGYGILSVI